MTLMFMWWLGLLLALQQPRDLPPGERSGSSELAGTVITAEPASPPVRGAIVTATVDGVTRATITDAGGRFHFRELPAGRVLVSARKPGFVTTFFGAKRAGQPGAPIVVGPRQQASGVTIALPRGAVITGIVRHSDGAPAASVAIAAVRVTRNANMRPLSEGPSVTSDDRGAYRLFDLAPGEYVVIALPPFMLGSVLGSGAIGLRSVGEVDAIFQRLQQRSKVNPAASPVLGQIGPASTAVGYVPIYYPGSAVQSEAARVRVAAGEERGGVDFSVPLVRAMTIDGAIAHQSAATPILSITPDEPYGRLPGFLIPGTTPSLAGRPDSDGRFQYTGVPPGRYTITARTGGETDRQWAMADVILSNSDVTGLVLSMQPGIRVTGRVVVDREPGTAGQFDVTKVLVSMRRDGPLYNAVMNGPSMGIQGGGSALVRADGTFVVEGLIPGEFRIAVSTTPPGPWRLQSATLSGRDLLDGFPLTVGGLNGIVLTMSNRHTAFEGRLHAPSGDSTAEYFVLTFPADRALWRPGSRRVQFTRPSTDGDFVIRDLPAGQYRVAALTDLDPDELTNPALLEQALALSIPFAIEEGQTVRQDIKVN